MSAVAVPSGLKSDVEIPYLQCQVAAEVVGTSNLNSCTLVVYEALTYSTEYAGQYYVFCGIRNSRKNLFEIDALVQQKAASDVKAPSAYCGAAAQAPSVGVEVMSQH